MRDRRLDTRALALHHGYQMGWRDQRGYFSEDCLFSPMRYCLLPRHVHNSRTRVQTANHSHLHLLYRLPSHARPPYFEKELNGWAEEMRMVARLFANNATILHDNLVGSFLVVVEAAAAVVAPEAEAAAEVASRAEARAHDGHVDCALFAGHALGRVGQNCWIHPAHGR